MDLVFGVGRGLYICCRRAFLTFQIRSGRVCMRTSFCSARFCAMPEGVPNGRTEHAGIDCPGIPKNKERCAQEPLSLMELMLCSVWLCRPAAVQIRMHSAVAHNPQHASSHPAGCVPVPGVQLLPAAGTSQVRVS